MKEPVALLLAAGAAWMWSTSRAALCFALVPMHPTATTSKLARRQDTNGKSTSNHAAPFLFPKTVTTVSSKQQWTCTSTTRTALGVTPSPLFSSVTAVRNAATWPFVRRAFLTLVAALAVVFRNRIFWPGAVADKSFSEPLPPGTYGCPIVGHNIMASSPSYGFGFFFTKLFKRLGRPKLFKFYGLGRPFVSVTGKDAIQAVVKREFSNNGGGVKTIDMSFFPNALDIFGKSSVLYENDKDQHARLRRLVGVAMTPKALEAAVPSIQSAAERSVENDIIKAAATAASEKEHGDRVVTMFRVNNKFTLDVAWKQILGLELETPAEIAEFHKNVQAWIKSLTSPLIYAPFRLPWLKRTAGYKAKEYLVNVVEKKLEKLDREGPDGSTLSNIYFATDDDGVTRLPRQVVIDNALILIMAGSETSSSTLTTAMLLMGLHPDALRKLQEEQNTVIEEHGGTTELTKEILDDECPYLDAFLKETMRIRPVAALEMRHTESTIVIDGQQIPRKWSVWLNVRATHDQDPACRANDNDDHMDIGKGFVPERWFEAETRPVEYLPWGEGARRCLGERLAVTEMKVFLATVARKLKSFDLVGVDSTSDVRWKALSATPYPKDGLVIRPVAAAATAAADTEISPSTSSFFNSTIVT